MRGPGPELMAFSKKKKEREKNGLASLKTKGRGKLVELLGDIMSVLHPSHPHHTLYTLPCFRFADRVPSFFFSFSTVKQKNEHSSVFCFLWSVRRAALLRMLAYAVRFMLSAPYFSPFEAFGRPRHAVYPHFAA
jgi:hypothetical protein